MINEGDSLYTDYFLLQEEVDNSLFYKILFPQVYNQNLNRITEVGVETNYSAYDKNVKLPIEVSINVVDSEENYLYVDHYFIYEKENEIIPFLQFYNNQQIYDYYCKNCTSYSFDKYGRIPRGMTISQETIESQVDYLEYLSVRLAES
ncbi:hypothetical protein [Sphingobacterium bovistauri]|uniref:Uncharacterized protein n=1 Tax=Sphingobacterium bovistauri TaxID=2781959 RepID=A0ABS7Z4Y7_9SPHI|nr:hypothetical protein [Sphingobacterium bovistauri]MCA5005256.1 hypothetical protein [Sphingobacterium bovistauri]